MITINKKVSLFFATALFCLSAFFIAGCSDSGSGTSGEITEQDQTLTGPAPASVPSSTELPGADINNPAQNVDPCTLLIKDDLTAVGITAEGDPVKSMNPYPVVSRNPNGTWNTTYGTISESVDCAYYWNNKSSYMIVRLDTMKPESMFRAGRWVGPTPSEDVAGVGDEAYFKMFFTNPILSVRKGGASFALQSNLPCANKGCLDLLKTLAQNVLSRIPAILVSTREASASGGTDQVSQNTAGNTAPGSGCNVNVNITGAATISGIFPATVKYSTTLGVYNRGYVQIDSTLTDGWHLSVGNMAEYRPGLQGGNATAVLENRGQGRSLWLKNGTVNFSDSVKTAGVQGTFGSFLYSNTPGNSAQITANFTCP